jgi:hypothetical protein
VIRWLAPAALLACALPLTAQEASVLLGGAHARYADSLGGSAGFVGVRLGLGRTGAAARFEAAVSRFAEGGWATQLNAQASSLWPVAGGPLLLGFAAGATFNTIDGESGSGTGAVGPMLAIRTARAHLVAGASAGAYRTIDGVWSPLASGSLRGYWFPHPQVGIDVGGMGIGADTLWFADLGARARVTGGPVQVGFLGGIRAGDLSDGFWGAVEMAVAAGARVSLEVSAGRYPPDLTGFGGGAYGQVGMRVFVMRAPTAIRVPKLPVEARRVDARRVRLTLRYGAPVARLEIAGDWNGWKPTPLVQERDGRWSVELEIGPGAYGYALVANGDWVLPDGVEGVDDDFGGRVATLLVPL